MIAKDYLLISKLYKSLKNMLATLIIILFGYFLISCHSDENKIVDPKNEETKVDTLIPLKLGNYWIYQTINSTNDDGSGGTPFYLKSGFIIDGKMELNIYGKKITAYKLFPCMEDLDPGYDKPGTFKGSKLIYQGKEGVYFYGGEKFDSLITFDNELIFTAKFGIGKEYRAHKFYYNTSGNYNPDFDELMTTYELISLDSLISTPAGEFKCIVYKMVVLDIYPLFREDVYFFINSKIGIIALTRMIYHYNLGTYRHTRKQLLSHYKIN